MSGYPTYQELGAVKYPEMQARVSGMSGFLSVAWVSNADT